MPALLLCLLFLLALPAAAAPEIVSHRPVVVVDGPALRLGDLFDGAGARAEATIAASPAPGQRLVLDAAQLAGIARAHGLAWRPMGGQERTVIDRPGRPVTRDDIIGALRAALLHQGLDPDSDLELGPLQTPMVPPGVPLHLAAETAAYDPASGRFSATLLVVAEGMPAQRHRIAGRSVATIAVLVPARRLGRGEVLRAEDVHEVRLRAQSVRPGMAQDAAQVVGQQLRRPVAPGIPLALADLAAPTLVERNALVTMVLDAPGLTLTAQGRALQAAPRGGTLSVMNLSSRTVVEGKVIGPDRVRVTASLR